MHMLNRLFRHPLLWAGAVALVLAGCIISGQFVIVVEWGGIVSTDTQLNDEFVDLTTNETWQDHKDDIQSIVDAKFEVTITNNLGTTASGEVYVSDQGNLTLEDLDTKATRILFGIEVPGNQSVTIGFNESAQYQENLQTLLDLAETGQFYLYGVAASTPFNIEIQQGSRILVTLSAGG
ncbi:MAG: hypothetical protein Kow0074_02370 [Candidatus Zixiibacteriota bacterium]